MKKTFALALGLIWFAIFDLSAQKFGFCNSTQLLSEIAEVKAADSQLKDFQTQLTKRGQEMVKSLQDKAADLQKKQELGLISPNEYSTQEAKLQKEEQDISAYEQEVYTKLTQKRELLYKPILDKVNEAMKKVATENGFTFVFDNSSQVLIYTDPSLDVTNLVKAKLAAN